MKTKDINPFIAFRFIVFMDFCLIFMVVLLHWEENLFRRDLNGIFCENILEKKLFYQNQN